MIDTVVDTSILDFLEWLTSGERSYRELIDVWGMSCPKLPVWEDARDRGCVAPENFNGREVVRLTSAGLTFLQQRKASRRPAASQPA